MNPDYNIINGALDLIKREMGKVKKTRKKVSAAVSRVIVKNEERINNLGNKKVK